MKLRWLAAVLVSTALVASPALAANQCPGGATNQGAMWWSILHPGFGEAKVQGKNMWSESPRKKFWYGWIPFFGWPGYLQVKSAIDASQCKTNDDLFKW